MPIDVEHATDEEFQQFVVRSKIRVNEKGIVEWSFDDRVGVINFALRNNISLETLPENTPENNLEGKKNNSDRELFVVRQPAPEGA